VHFVKSPSSRMKLRRVCAEVSDSRRSSETFAREPSPRGSGRVRRGYVAACTPRAPRGRRQTPRTRSVRHQVSRLRNHTKAGRGYGEETIRVEGEVVQ
jgi:hypothetical protein